MQTIYTAQNLLSELKTQGVLIRPTTAGKLSIAGEMSAAQLDAIKELKSEIIDLINFRTDSLVANKSLPSNSDAANPQIEAAPVQKEVCISDFITRLQMSGVKFYLSPRCFETGGRALSRTERERLRINAGRVLCQLQQAALERFIFKSFPGLRERFKFEVLEREMILLDSDEPNALYKAVRQTAFIWFHDYFLDGAMN